MQVDVFIDCFLVCGCLLLARGQSLGGAALIGLAAAFKGPPLLFAAYLLLRRRFAAAAATVLVAVTLNLLPDLIIPPAGGEPRLMFWLEHFVFNTLGGQLGSWDGMSIFNQSIAGTLQRLATSTLDFAPAEPRYVPNARAVSQVEVKVLAYGLMAILALAAMLAALRGEARLRRAPAARSTGRDDDVESGRSAPGNCRGRLPSLTALELSSVAILMLLMSPMSHITHLGVLVLPAFCLARIAACTGNRVITVTLIIAALAGIGVNKDLIGNFLYSIYLWSGFPTLGLLMLLLGCCIAMARGECEPPRTARQSVRSGQACAPPVVENRVTG
jgi:hypothetical protein